MRQIDKLFLEALDGLNAGTPLPLSQPPAKDFGPSNKGQPYSYPYQSNIDAMANLGANQAITNLPLVPYELAGVDADLADSAVYLASALDKISLALKNTNITLSDTQKDFLKECLKNLSPSLTDIKTAGNKIITIINLAYDFPSLMSRNVEEV